MPLSCREQTWQLFRATWCPIAVMRSIAMPVGRRALALLAGLALAMFAGCRSDSKPVGPNDARPPSTSITQTSTAEVIPDPCGNLSMQDGDPKQTTIRSEDELPASSPLLKSTLPHSLPPQATLIANATPLLDDLPAEFVSSPSGASRVPRNLARTPLSPFSASTAAGES